jgi:hypothetical protein
VSLSSKKSLRDCVYFNRFIAKCNARKVHSRRYVIEDNEGPRYNNLRKEVGRIIIDAGGKLVCSPKAYEPSDDERKLIEGELAKISLPSSVLATNALVNRLAKGLKVMPASLYLYRTEGGDKFQNVIFVQQRVLRKDGTKADIPHTYMSTGEWEKREPDGALPLYGLEQLSSAASIMIHEGPKVAKFLQELTNGRAENRERLDRHPWRESLERCTHLGWPGGALNPHRVDWGPIRRQPDHVSITLVCDNDDVGKAAAAKIAKSLKRRMTIVMFGNEFPVGFDLADEFPRKLFDQFGTYVGPTLADCERSGTWATHWEEKK